MTGDPMGRKPLRTLRSQWSELAHPLLPGCESFLRRTHDGVLMALFGDEPAIGWHLSISHRGHNGKVHRYPSWDEIADARDLFLPADIGFVMHLPPADEYVALHDSTFHLHQHPAPGKVLLDRTAVYKLLDLAELTEDKSAGERAAVAAARDALA